LKGSILRNTDYVYGIACYTGHQTKVMENSLEARVKKSKVELQTNLYIIIIVAIQLSVCLLCSLINMIFTAKNKETLTYLFYDDTQSNGNLFFTSFF
jgi:phospholipid-transporting ATPase